MIKLITDVLQEYKDDIVGVSDFCDSKYNELFESHFKEVDTLYRKMQSSVYTISDSELEYILIMLPMELIAVAEKLSQLKLEQQVVKLKNKEKFEEFRNQLIEESTIRGLNKSHVQEFVSHGMNQLVVDYELVVSAYETIINRVTSSQMFAKELIMGAKKVWDSRRSAESGSPVKPIATDLPDYDPTSSKSYIK